MSRPRRPTLIDKRIEHIDQHILFLQQERRELLQLVEDVDRTRARPKPTRLATARGDAVAIKD